MANIPNKTSDLIKRHYQMVIFTTETSIVLTTTLTTRSDDPTLCDALLVKNLLKKIFLIELKARFLLEQFYYSHVENILKIDNLPELIEYNENTIFGYIIQDITDPIEPVTLISQPINLPD